MLRPYFIGGIFLGLVLWFGSRYLIPKANEIRSNFQTNYFDKNNTVKNIQRSNCYNCYYRRIDSLTYLGIKNYIPQAKPAPLFSSIASEMTG